MYTLHSLPSIGYYILSVLSIILHYFLLNIRRKGSKRRLVIPSKLGYKNTEQLPIPAEFSQRQRLYSTVFNNVRGNQEKTALGDSLAGKLVLDVKLLRISPK